MIIPVSQPVEDVAQQIENAFARGADEARLAADAEHERKLAQVLAETEQQRAADRARWAREQADELAARLTSAVNSLEERIAEAVGRVLTPFLTSEMRSMSVRSLAESIGALLSGGSRPSLRISGPEDLLSALREKLGACPVAIDWQPNEQVEVTVATDDSVIETEIQSWIDRIAGAGR